MDVRVVLLEKIAPLKQGCFQKNKAFPSGTVGPWVTLGHFDAMYTYHLNIGERGMFAAMSEENVRVAALNDVNSYFHPLYLVAEDDDSSFWDASSWYFAIVRIHFAQNIDTTEMRAWLGQQLKNDTQDKPFQFYSYRTIELSDMILALKSNNIKEMLTFILTLRRYSCIGKVYTYCGINYSYIQAFSRNRNSLPVALEVNDQIPMFSMRFSIIDPQKATVAIEDIQGVFGTETQYSVVGVDDITISWNPLDAKKVIDLFGKWFVPSHENSLARCSEEAFSEITTRVGVPLEPELLKPIDYHMNSDSSIRLQTACINLVHIDKDIHRQAKRYLGLEQCETVHRWLKSLSELTKTLVRMSRTPVMDEFVYLMLPGVRSFLLNLKNQLEKKHNFLDSDVTKYQKFVAQWTDLMEHVMRLEGQLSHHPEMRPVIYDMPIAMLEYTLAFLRQCADVLQTKDSPKMEIDFLLVPQLCERIDSNELFPASHNMPGLVLVSIPLHILYDSATMQSSLCHETSHFVGEYCRCRVDRVWYYTNSVAVLMAKTIFQTYSPSVIRVIQENLENLLSNHHADRLEMLESRILSWLETNLLTEERFSDFIRQVLCHHKRSENNDLSQMRESSVVFEIENNLSRLENDACLVFAPLLSDLTTLFREAYADLCMMYLLNLNPVTYIENVLDEFSLDDGDNRYEQFAIKTVVCLTVSGRSIPKQSAVRSTPELSPFYNAIEQLLSDLNSDEESTNRELPIGAILSLREYIRECHDVLVSSLEESHQLARLRDLAHHMSTSEFNYGEMEEAINIFRKRLLQSE